MISSPPNGETQAMSNAEEYEDRAARIASELGELCETHQIVVGVAESLTGGKIASQLAAVPGSGNWFAGAVVAYFSDVKHQLLRVPRGPVISQTAAESMASSACTLLGSDAAVAASGAGALRARRGRSQARHGLLSLSARKCTPNDRSSPANQSRSSLRLRNGRWHYCGTSCAKRSDSSGVWRSGLKQQGNRPLHPGIKEPQTVTTASTFRPAQRRCSRQASPPPGPLRQPVPRWGLRDGSPTPRHRMLDRRRSSRHRAHHRR